MSYPILTHLLVKVSLATVFASWFYIYIYDLSDLSGSERVKETLFMQSLEPFFHLLASTCVICVYRMKIASFVVAVVVAVIWYACTCSATTD